MGSPNIENFWLIKLRDSKQKIFAFQARRDGVLIQNYRLIIEKDLYNIKNFKNCRAYKISAIKYIRLTNTIYITIYICINWLNEK